MSSIAPTDLEIFPGHVSVYAFTKMLYYMKRIDVSKIKVNDLFSPLLDFVDVYFM